MKHVYKSFGPVEVLKDFNLQLTEGEKVVIIGPSGSGKSTVLRCINRLETIQSGSIFFESQAITDQSNLCALRMHIGMVFQRFNLFPHMTALGNVMEAPVHVRQMPASEAERLARELLGKVGLADKLHMYPAKLSGGQQQRVAIARALINQPAMILADEPTGNLDTRSSAEVVDLLHKVHAAGATIVMVTHEPDIALHAQRVVCVRDGKVVSDGRDGTVHCLERGGHDDVH